MVGMPAMYTLGIPTMVYTSLVCLPGYTPVHTPVLQQRVYTSGSRLMPAESTLGSRREYTLGRERTLRKVVNSC